MSKEGDYYIVAIGFDNLHCSHHLRDKGWSHQLRQTFLTVYLHLLGLLSFFLSFFKPDLLMRLEGSKLTLANVWISSYLNLHLVELMNVNICEYIFLPGTNLITWVSVCKVTVFLKAVSSWSYPPVTTRWG